MTPGERAVAALRAAGQTLAVAESLTGGLVCDAVVAVPGASAVLRGGVVAYATGLKHDLLGVDGDLLAAVGPVHPDVAAGMAAGVRDRLAATWGVATTGVAGPDPQDGHPPGTVYVAVAGPGPGPGAPGSGPGPEVVVRRLDLGGDRQAVRRAAVDAALGLLVDQLASSHQELSSS